MNDTINCWSGQNHHTLVAQSVTFASKKLLQMERNVYLHNNIIDPELAFNFVVD